MSRIIIGALRRQTCRKNSPEMAGSGKDRKQGGLRTMPFILANEICDRFATSGLHSNLITYLTQQLHMPLVQASNTLTNFAGTSSLTPLLGAWIADSFAGRFWTITIASIIYQLGMISLTISAILPTFRPRPCKANEPCPKASTWQLWVLYITFLLMALGSGGIRPCVVAFGADQIDMTEAKRAGRTWNFFNWFYFSMGIATLVALTSVVYIQENVGWGWGLGIPSMAMALSMVIFVLGYPLYRNFKPAGSPLTRLAQVVVAAIRKRKVVKPINPDLLYVNKELDASISIAGRLLHTDQLKFFDRAAIVTESDTPESDPPNLWRLATVHRVEELKSVIRMIPIWAAGILLVTASSNQTTFSIQQARTMDRHVSTSFQIPPATMSIFSILFMLLTIVLYDRIFVPLARRFSGHPSGISYLRRMGIGFAISVLATLVSGFIEVRRKNVAANHGLLDNPKAVIPISVFWLVPQYCLHGVAEAFMSVGHLEFLYDQSPESMRSTAAALYWMAISAGNYLSTLLVSLVHKYSGKERNWLPDRNLNRGRLECYYWLVTGLQVFNLGYYVVCARFYTYKKLEVVGPTVPTKPITEMEEIGYVDIPMTDTAVNVSYVGPTGSMDNGAISVVELVEVNSHTPQVGPGPSD